MNIMLLFTLLIVVLGSLSIWTLLELKTRGRETLIAGLICLLMSCSATFVITQLAYKVRAAYEQASSMSVIVGLSEHVEPSKRTLIRSAVREFEQEAGQAQGYLPAVIKVKNRLNSMGNGGE